MSKLSLLLNVYNEADMLEHLETVLKHVDETVIIEGGPIGESVDGTADIIAEYQRKYPIKFIQGTFRREDDAGYNQSRMKNLLLSESTGDFIMFHHADIVYDEKSMVTLRDALDKFPNKAIYYSPMFEFFYDMDHIRLYHFPVEGMLYRPICGDVPVYSMQFDPNYIEVPTVGLTLRKQWDFYDALFIPDVKRYHLCFVRSFSHQVEKHVRRICQRDWGGAGDKILLNGFETVFQRALEHVESYPIDTAAFDYHGDYPESLKDKHYCAFDGTEEFHDNIDKYKERFSAYYPTDYYNSDKYVRWEK